MNDLKIFENQEFGKVRMVEIEGKPYAVGVDVARALGYENATKAVINHCKNIRKEVIEAQSQNGMVVKTETNLIAEGDIYRLIVKAADQSKNPEIKAKAERFERWIFDEVLPSIRKTGGYVANEDVFIATYLPYADEQTKTLFKSTLEVIRKQNETIQLMQPKAEYFDALVDRRLLTNFRDTAKELKIKERDFIQWLLDKKYIYRDIKGDLKPYAQYNGKYFEMKEWARNEKAGTQTLITPKGRETFRLLLMKDGLIKAS